MLLAIIPGETAQNIQYDIASIVIVIIIVVFDVVCYYYYYYYWVHKMTVHQP